MLERFFLGPYEPLENSLTDFNVSISTQQNHSITEWSQLAGISGGHAVQNPCSSRGQLEPVTQDYIQVSIEYLQGGALGNLSEQPVSVLSHPHSEKAFPGVQEKPPVFQCMPITSVPVTGDY